MYFTSVALKAGKSNHSAGIVEKGEKLENRKQISGFPPRCLCTFLHSSPDFDIMAYPLYLSEDVLYLEVPLHIDFCVDNPIHT